MLISCLQVLKGYSTTAGIPFYSSSWNKYPTPTPHHSVQSSQMTLIIEPALVEIHRPNFYLFYFKHILMWLCPHKHIRPMRWPDTNQYGGWSSKNWQNGLQSALNYLTALWIFSTDCLRSNIQWPRCEISEVFNTSVQHRKPLTAGREIKRWEYTPIVVKYSIFFFGGGDIKFSIYQRWF